MKRANIFKKITTTMAIFALAATTLTGCSKDGQGGNATDTDATGTDAQVEVNTEAAQTKIMVVGDYDIYLDEALVYAFQNIYLRGDSPEDWSDAKDSTVKKEVLSSIRESKILSHVARNNDCVLEEADLAIVEETSTNFKKAFGDEILAKYGISEEVIDRVFEEQALITKFETQIKNEMGQTIYDDFLVEFEDYRFKSTYVLLFPTVEKDENDDPALDDAGNYISLSDEEKEAVRAQAEEALGKLRDGADYLEIVEEYGISNYSSTASGYISDEESTYSDVLTEAIADLNDGEASEVIEGSLGYQIVYVISADDQGLRESYVYMLASERRDSEYETLRLNWLNTIQIHEEGDMEGTVWADYSLLNIVEDLSK